MKVRIVLFHLFVAVSLCVMLSVERTVYAQSLKGKRAVFSQLDFDTGTPTKTTENKKDDWAKQEEPIFRERVNSFSHVRKEGKRPLTLEQKRWSKVEQDAKERAYEQKLRGHDSIRVLNTEDLIRATESSGKAEISE